jgi:hypothetical protein
MLKRKSAKAALPSVDPRSLFRGTKKSLWNFWEHGVTSSFVDRFQDCRRQTELTYVEGYTSRSISEGLEFGTLCHYILEQVYTDYHNITFSVPDMEDIRSYVEEYETFWRKAVPNPTEAQLAQQELCYAKAEALLPAYFARYSGDFTGKYIPTLSVVQPKKFVALEGEFSVPYVFPDGAKTVLRGKRDMVFLDAKGGEYILDSKFLSIIEPKIIIKTMPVNFQLNLYIHARAEENKLAGRPAPKGAMLNIARRPQTRYNPEKESLSDYAERTAEAVADPKKYPKNFLRIAMTVAPSETKEWKETTLDPIMDDIRGWWDGRYPHYRSPKHVAGKYGLSDMFNLLVENDPSNVYKRTKPFNELLDV